jgi:hypothetical protein
MPSQSDCIDGKQGEAGFVLRRCTRAGKSTGPRKRRVPMSTVPRVTDTWTHSGRHLASKRRLPPSRTQRHREGTRIHVEGIISPSSPSVVEADSRGTVSGHFMNGFRNRILSGVSTADRPFQEPRLYGVLLGCIIFCPAAAGSNPASAIESPAAGAQRSP